MIEYIQIRDKTSREIIGIIDSANSVIWHTVYFGVGDFEIYVEATNRNIELLQEGNYVSRPNDYGDGKYKMIGVIEHIETLGNESMIIAIGRFAKSLLDRRHIFNLTTSGYKTINNPTVLTGKVEVAVRSLVSDNAINCSFNSNRNITFLELGSLATPEITEIIVDENGNATQKQVSFDNLLNFTDELLEEYQLGSYICFDDISKKLQFIVFKGVNRSSNTSSPVIFSAEFDNLTETKYLIDVSNKKTAALIGGVGENIDRFYSIVDGEENGVNRRETFIDASSLSKTYKNSQYIEITYTDSEYKSMLDSKAKQTLSTLIVTEIFEGKLDVTGGVWKLNEHYFLGDIVTIQDNKLNKYANVRIIEVTEIQDENGYSVEITYKNT